MTIFASPLHILPQQVEAPRYIDQVGNGAEVVRRKWLRGKSSWQLEVPGKQELLDPIWGLLEYAQGDRIIWFDGAGFGEVTTPTMIGEGDGNTTDFMLPHRFVYFASLVVYTGGTLDANWVPIGGDGITCDAIRFGGGVAANHAVTAKYRRRIKCLLKVEDTMGRSRVFRSTDPLANIHSLKFTLEECFV